MVPPDTVAGRLKRRLGSLELKLIAMVSTSLKASSNVICSGPVIPELVIGAKLPVRTSAALPREATEPVCASRRSFDQVLLVFPITRFRFIFVDVCASAATANNVVNVNRAFQAPL